MVDFNPIFEFSRNHCIGICAFLVPLNLLTTSLTLLLVYFGRSLTQIRIVTVFASIFALGLFFHVTSWLLIGMVMLPTFILPILAVVCILINFWAGCFVPTGYSAQENTRWLRGLISGVVKLYEAQFDPHLIKTPLSVPVAEE
jgi:hypothetical protein